MGCFHKVRRTIFQLFRDAKVGDFDATLVVNQDVRTLDVPMDDTSLVDIVQPLQDLANKVADEGLFEGAVVSQQRGDGTAWDVFQEDVEVLVIRR